MADTLRQKIQDLKSFFDTIEKRSVLASQAVDKINESFSRLLQTGSLTMGLEEYSKSLDTIIKNSNIASSSIDDFIKKAKEAWASAISLSSSERKVSFSKALTGLEKAGFGEQLREQFSRAELNKANLEKFSRDLTSIFKEGFTVNSREAEESIKRLTQALNILGSRGIDPALENWFKNLFKTIINGTNYSSESLSKLLSTIRQFSSSTGYLTNTFSDLSKSLFQEQTSPIAEQLKNVFPNFLSGIDLTKNPLALLRRYMSVDPSKKTSPFLTIAQKDIDLAVQYYRTIASLSEIFLNLAGASDEARKIIAQYNKEVAASLNYVKSGRGAEIPLQNFLNQMSPYKGTLFDVNLKKEFQELISEQDTKKLEERIDRIARKLQQLGMSPAQAIRSFSDITIKAKDLDRTTAVLDRLSARFSEIGGQLPFGLKDLFSDFIGEENAVKAIDNINRKIREFGFSFSDLKGISREASTGITRLTFQTEKPISESVSALDNLNLTLSKSGDILSDTQKRFRSFFSAITRDIGEVVKWGIAVSLIYGPFRKVQDLVSEMIVNQAKLAEIQIVTGQSSEQVAKGFDSILKIAAKTGENVNNVAEAFKMAYIAAGSVRDENLRSAVATRLLSDTLALARLSGLSAEESLDILSATLKQLGMDLTEGSVLLDKWIAVSKQANVDLQTLATSFSIISSAGENAGLSIDQMNGIIAATAEVSSLSAREVGNMIRAFISGYQTDTAVKELEKYGIAVRDVSGNIRNFMEIFSEIKNLSSIGVISEPQLARISETLGGGARRGAQVAAFIKNLDVINQISEVSRTAERGLAEQALEVRLATLDATTNKLRLSFSKLSQSLGTKGGLLDFLISLNEQLINVTDAMSGLVSLLGSSTLPLLLASLSTLFLATNRGADFGLRGALGSAAYGIGSFIGKTGFKLFGRGGEESFPFISPLTGKTFYQPKTAPIQPQTLDQALAGIGAEIPLVITGAEAAGDKIGGRLAVFLQKNTQWVIPSALVFSRVVSDLISKDFERAGAGLAGSFVGALAGKKFLSGIFGASAGTIGMLIGYAIVEAIINASRNNFDLQQVFAENFISAQREATQEKVSATSVLEELKKERDAIEKELIKSTSSRVSALGLINKTLYGERGLEEAFNFSVRAQYQFLKLIGKIDEKKVTESQFAFGTLMALGDEELVRRYDEINKKILTFESNLAGNLVSQTDATIDTILKQYSGVIDSLIQEQKSKLFESAGVDITPTSFREKIDALGSIGTKTANYFNLVGKEFEKSMGLVGESDKAFKSLAEILLRLSPQESEVLVRYLGTIQTLTESYGEGSEEVKRYKDELASLLTILYRNQQIQSFTMPTVMGEVFTEKEANLIAERARQMTVEFYRDMLPDDSLIPAFLSQLTPIAVRVSREAGEKAGEEFWKKYTEVGPGMFDKAKKELQDLGLIGAKDLRIEPMLDMTKANFDSVVRPLISKFENILIKSFYGTRENLPTETIGIVFKDGTDKINVNLLALRMALDKTNELLQKQLDGIFNLPEGAELWVPAQAAELALQTLRGMEGAADAGELIVPENMNEVESQFGLLAQSANEASLALQGISTIMDSFLIEKLDAEMKARNLQEEGADWLRRMFGETPGPRPSTNLAGVAAVREVDRTVDSDDKLLRDLRNKILREQFMRKELVPQDTAKPVSEDVLSRIANLLPALGGLITILKVLSGKYDVNWSPRQPRSDITPRSTLFIPTTTTMPVPKVDLTVNTTNQVVLDGRIIALALKRYLARDLRVAVGGRSVSNNFFV